MSRGSKLLTEQVEKIKHTYAAIGNTNEVSRMLGIPESTVRTYIGKMEKNGELDELRKKKKEEFGDIADRIIMKGLQRIEQALDNDGDSIPINQLSTMVGTIYDKRALESGRATNNIEIVVKLPNGAEEYAD